MYRGILPPLLSVGFIQSINFSIYECSKFKITEIMQSKAYVGKYLYSFYITSNSDVNHLINVFTAGTISGSCISIITTPISIIKLQQQVASEKGIIKCITDIYSKAGISGFYRGFGSVVILESLGRGDFICYYRCFYLFYLSIFLYILGSYLGTYEASKIIIDKIYTQILNRQQQQSKQHHHIKDSLSVRMSSAAIAGCFSWLLFYPLDVLKSRIQLDFNRIKYNNAFDCLLISLRSGGIRSLYSGISYTLMRAGLLL